MTFSLFGFLLLGFLGFLAFLVLSLFLLRASFCRLLRLLRLFFLDRLHISGLLRVLLRPSLLQFGQSARD